MTGWIDRLHGWLAPDEGECPVCGRRRRGTPDTPIPVRHAGPRRALRELCEPCLARIPWIVRIACPICGRPSPCGDCLRREDRQFERCRGAVRYDETMKEWLAMYKYRGLEKLGPIMAAMLAGAVERLCPEGERPNRYFHAITFVPLASERLADRGFNQAERMARAVAGWYGLPCVDALRRLRHTEKQSLKSRRGRMEDMKGNFAAASPKADGAALLPGDKLRLLVVDDVYTTGSTMNECARVMRQAGMGGTDTRVYGALWARS